jgi:hypothetical protein
MAPDEYSKALDKALSDLQLGVQQRDLLNASIAGLRETVRVLSTLVKMPPDKQRDIAKLLAMADYATPSLTDAIRSLLLSVSPKEMTAIEVRNELEDSSDTEGCSLSACHAALKRMLSDGEIELGPPRNGKATYRRMLKLEAANSYYSVLGGLNVLAGLANVYSGLGNVYSGLGEEATKGGSIPGADPAHKLGDGARFPKAPKPPLTPGAAKRMMQELLPKK